MPAVAEKPSLNDHRVREVRAETDADKSVEFGSLPLRAKFRYGGVTYEKGQSIDKSTSQAHCLSDPAQSQAFFHNTRVDPV